ncbi:YihY/virulence factor BrkB family protein [Mycoplasma procyoni]|uniref:YihY/virulence factor BrkB family protein n=1 Tax=Mycoplasma procyoni TaxID=568784 RepID=UPI00197C413F|nr:YhjD/YihY/BrkB family envelope integrity protein [Mycoplasma procyoni]MBN3534783.1 YihY/virulence factor BrkB family protein [Mycoplasma procyoni]
MRENNWFKDRVIKRKNRNYLEKIMSFLMLIPLKIAIKPKWWKEKREDARSLVPRSLKKLSSAEFSFIPAGFALYLFLSFIPVVIIALSIISSIDLSWIDPKLLNLKGFIISDILNRYIPGLDNSLPQTLSIFSSSAWETTTFVILLLSAFALASGGYAKFIESQSILYHHKNTGNIIMNRLKGIVYVLLISVFLAFVLILAGIAFYYLKQALEGRDYIYNSIFYIISFVFISLFFYFIWLFLFKFSPVFKLQIKHILPGTLISTLSCVIFSVLFGFLASAKFVNYDKYGTLATFLYLSTFVFYISYFLYFGVIINEVFYKSFFGENTKNKYTFQSKKIN